jgi:hypothetical protein
LPKGSAFRINQHENGCPILCEAKGGKAIP